MKKIFKKTEGFTLVELIVVIAILGILAGVGTVGYSGYIKKANMAADQQLVSQVFNALQLQYYSTPDNEKTDYVILNLNADADDGEEGVADAAMKAAFGDEWKKTVSLKYDGWSVGGAWDAVLADLESAPLIADSSYLKYSSAGNLVTAVSSVANALGNMAGTAEDDPLTTLQNLNVLTAGEASTIRNQLANDYSLSWDSGEDADNSAYSAALSNALVNYATNEIANAAAIETPSQLTMLATQYALIYAWGSSSEEGAETLAQLNAAVTREDANAAGIVGVFATLDRSEGSPLFKYMGSTQGQTDAAALTSIMKAVNDISGDYDMTTPNLYASGSVADQINNYVGSVTAVADMERAGQEIPNIEDDQVVVFITPNGVISPIPNVLNASN